MKRVWWNGRWYRARMRLLHRFNLCWMQPTPLRDGRHGQWVNVWCHWCGVRGKRLDLAHACTPNCARCALAPVDNPGPAPSATDDYPTPCKTCTNPVWNVRGELLHTTGHTACHMWEAS